MTDSPIYHDPNGEPNPTCPDNWHASCGECDWSVEKQTPVPGTPTPTGQT